jgi:galactose mutarotase-like enzyme
MPTVDFDGETAYVLRDGSGAEAVVLPSVGESCLAFRTPVDGRPAYLLSTPPSLEVLRARPTMWGFPILSPYPGRHQTPFRWRGASYRIAENDRPGVAIHGIVAVSPWEVVEAAGDSLTARFDSERAPERAARWPWPFLLTATHRVADGALTLDLALTNRADEAVPHLLGLHPYVPLRVTPAGAMGTRGLPTADELAGDAPQRWRETCRVWVAGDHLWEMRQGLGTGTILDLDGDWDLRAPRSVAALEATLSVPPGGGQFGSDRQAQGPRLPVLLYGDRAALAAGEAGARAAEPGGVTSGVDDVASGVRVTLETSLGFGSLALFCPPGRPFISLEPRSAVSDALTLMHAPGVPPTGVCALGPGETWRARVRLSAAPLIGAGR